MQNPGEHKDDGVRATIIYTVLTLICCALLGVVGYYMFRFEPPEAEPKFVPPAEQGEQAPGTKKQDAPE